MLVFGEHRDTDRQTDREQGAEHRPARPFEVGEQLARSIRRGAAYPEQHGQQHEQHDQRRCDTAANTAECRRAELAVDEDVVERDIQQQAENPDHHARARVAEAVAVATQHLVQPDRRKAAGNGAQVAHAGIDQRGFDVHPVQHRLGVPHQDGAQAAEAAAHPQRLAHQRADLAVVSGAETLRHVRCGCQDHAGQEQKNRHPDGIAQGHCRQIVRTDPTRHHRIDEAHRRVGQLSDHHRQGKGEEGAQLGPHPAGSRLRRHCIVPVVYKERGSLRRTTAGRKAEKRRRGV
ncbi:hypothetical protein SSTU70S_03070 [Stutzerimonas stutzeri]